MRGFLPGMIAGIAVGATVGMFMTPGSKKNVSAIRKSADRAIRSITDIVDDFASHSPF